MTEGIVKFHMWAWKIIWIVMFAVIGVLLSIVAWAIIKEKKGC